MFDYTDDTGRKAMIRRILKVLGWIAGIWAAILLIAQIILSSSILTKTVNSIAAEFVDGEISFGDARVSLLRRFPKATVTLEDFSITYPAERFDSLERAGVQGHMLYHGTGETADTLASFKEFSASIRLLPLIKGEFHIPHVSLVQPRIFAHVYDEENANWNIFKLGSEEEEEEASSGLPVISLGHISLDRHPHIVYTDSKDTLFAMIDLAKLHFDGKLKTDRMSKAKIGLRMQGSFLIFCRKVGPAMFKAEKGVIHMPFQGIRPLRRRNHHPPDQHAHLHGERHCPPLRPAGHGGARLALHCPRR